MKQKAFPKVTYFDRFWYLELKYEDYVQMCEENEWPVHPEDSEGYWNDIWRVTEMEWDDFKGNMAYSKYDTARCMVTGTLGLWNGHPEITPILCNGVMEAIDKCLSGRSIEDWDITLVNGHIEVNAYHHDGSNCFEIHLLSAKGEREVERKKYTWDGYDYDPKPDWFKKIHGYLY